MAAGVPPPRASLSSTGHSITLNSSHRPRSVPSSALLTAGKLHRRSRRGQHRWSPWSGGYEPPQAVLRPPAVAPRHHGPSPLFLWSRQGLHHRSRELRHDRRRLLCFPPLAGGRSGRPLSLPLSVCMASGPNCEVGPACQFMWWRFWVHSRVHLAYLGLSS
jgi:hypothetical protein